jgi:hypothetical protein
MTIDTDIFKMPPGATLVSGAALEDPPTLNTEVDGAPPSGGGGISTFVHHQINPGATWSIVHNLGTKPSVVLFLDEDLTESVFTDLSYPDTSTLVVEWPSPQTGWAYLT